MAAATLGHDAATTAPPAAAADVQQAMDVVDEGNASVPTAEQAPMSNDVGVLQQQVRQLRGQVHAGLYP